MSILKDETEVPFILTDLSAFTTSCVCDMSDYNCRDNFCPNCKSDKVLKLYMDIWLGDETGDQIQRSIREYVESLYKGKQNQETAEDEKARPQIRAL